MKKSTLQISLPITIFKEGKSYVAYSTALDLSTSASTYKKAQSRFSEISQLFIERKKLNWFQRLWSYIMSKF